MHEFRPVISAFLTSAVIFVAVARLQLKRQAFYAHPTFKPPERVRDANGSIVETGRLVDFDPRHAHYLKTAEVITTLSSASILLLLQFHFAHSVPLFPYALVLLGLTVVFAILFMVFCTYFYEAFLYAPASYTKRRQVALIGFAFTGLFSFAIAYLSLAVQIAIMVTRGDINAH